MPYSLPKVEGYSKKRKEAIHRMLKINLHPLHVMKANLKTGIKPLIYGYGGAD